MVAVPTIWRSFKPLPRLGADTTPGIRPYENYMAVSINWRALFAGVLTTRASQLGVYTRAPEFLETPM